MIVAFSTSSPWTSVAAISPEGDVLWMAQREAPRRASEMCLQLLQEMESELSRPVSEATLFCADIGPGSFTGTRVGVILAKTLAFAYKVKVAGANAFDLISPRQTVVMPSKKGEWFIREPGQIPYRTSEIPSDQALVGFGFDQIPNQPPSAEHFASLLPNLILETAEAFVPEYLIDPSISIPNKPYAVHGA